MAINEPCIFEEKGKWTKHNIYLTMAIIAEYKLGGIALAILDYIIETYNQKKFTSLEKDASCSVSQTDLSKKLQTSPNVVYRAIKSLQDNKLIKITNKESRAGRGEYLYKPNIHLLNSILKEYLKMNPDDKTT